MIIDLSYSFKMGSTENISATQRFFLISQGIFQFFLAVFVTSTLWLMAYNRNWENLHTWHVFLCTIGCSFFMAEGVSLLNPGNVFVLGWSRVTKGYLHGFLMSLGAVALIAGVSIKIQDKINRNATTHFTSVHAITGLTAYLLTMLTLIFGVILIFAKLIYKTCNIKPVFLKTIHNFLGLAAYVLAIVSLCYGLRNSFSEASYATNTGFICILVIGTILNIFGPLKTFFRF